MRLCFLTPVHAVVLSRRLIAVLVYHQTGKPLIHPKSPLTLSHIAIINRAAGFSYYYYSLGLRRRSVPLAHFEPKGVFLQRHPKLFFPSSLSPRLLPHQYVKVSPARPFFFATFCGDWALVSSPKCGERREWSLFSPNPGAGVVLVGFRR